jgi:hypothetical protein
MADAKLATFMRNMLTAVVNKMNSQGDKRISSYFSRQFHNGCDSHPDLAEHQMIANELIAFIKKKMKW